MEKFTPPLPPSSSKTTGIFLERVLFMQQLQLQEIFKRLENDMRCQIEIVDCS